MKILLVGRGKMGGALLKRWEEMKLASEVQVVDPVGGTSFENLPTSFQPETVVFAVKPQILPDVAGKYKKFANALFLSIAAGKPISFFEQHLGATAKIVRAMPNTPAMIGQGITVACANKNAAGEKDRAATLLGAVGEVLWVEDEKLLNPVTALSGSGPAYVFLLIEALTSAGTKIGIPPAMAEKLARQTVIGSTLLAKESADISAATLRENVTSPGGTTAAALDVLMPEIHGLFARALDAANKRARELSEE